MMEVAEKKYREAKMVIACSAKEPHSTQRCYCLDVSRGVPTLPVLRWELPPESRMPYVSFTDALDTIIVKGAKAGIALFGGILEITVDERREIIAEGLVWGTPAYFQDGGPREEDMKQVKACFNYWWEQR